MRQYKVSVRRIGYALLDILVSADSKSEAADKAVAAAGNYEFLEHDADYHAGYVEEVTE